MRIILSRKGFDSQNGGIASPILFDKGNYNFFSLPIPYEEGHSYNDIIISNGKTALDFITDITPNLIFKKQKISVDKIKCHLDPDLIQQSLRHRTLENWEPAFGQYFNAQSHLDKYEIKKNDLFLFYGWFKFAEYESNKFKYCKILNDKFKNGFHAIYGYLQIDEKINVRKDISKFKNLKYHPHAGNKHLNKFSNNTIYTANEFLSFDKSIKGSGVLKYSPKCILTKEKNNRSIWELPFKDYSKDDIELTHNPHENWTPSENKIELKSAKIGQEFIFVKLNEEIINWSINLIKDNKIGSS